MIAATRRESTVRMSLMTIGVGVGVGLLLLVLTAVPALHARQERIAWRATGGESATAAGAGGGLWWLGADDHYRGRDLIRVDVAAAGPTAPVPVGLTRLPAPGEVAVSPALAK